MAFRADEAARTLYEKAERYLTPRGADEAQRMQIRQALQALVDELGPVVDAYPCWHPLIRNHDVMHPVIGPSDGCGYKGLDHTKCFVNGFITCPYGDGQSVIDSVAALPRHSAAWLSAKRMDVPFYSEGTTPILVKCVWDRPLEVGGMIPLALAMPLLLEHELKGLWRGEFAETWETMRPYLIGDPHGSRSSLFVSQETGQAIKTMWQALNRSGMFGPIKV